LIASLLAWVVLGPLASAAQSDATPWNVLLANVAAATFVGGLEGVFYSMIPISFMDGAVVWRWSKLAWLAMFGVTTFLFWQLVITQPAAYPRAFHQPTMVAFVIPLAVYGTPTAVTWAYFRFRKSHDETDDRDSGQAQSLREAAQDATAAE